jgi:hypothetical protein
MNLIDRLSGATIECRIAIVQPDSAVEPAARAMRFFDSVLWVFKSTARAQWQLGTVTEADVIVAHHQADPDELTLWRAAGKYVVVVSTDPTYHDPTAEAEGFMLLFPFQTAAAITLLSRLDGEIVTNRRHATKTLVATSTAKPNSAAVAETLSMLRSAGTGTQWQLGKVNDQFIWVSGDGRQYLCLPQTVQEIRAGAGCTELQVISQSTPPQGLVTRAGSELVWFLAYHASSELLFDLPKWASFRLLKWPDFGLVRVSNAAINAVQMRIVAALDVMPATIAELAYRASAAPIDVVRVINALHASGCIACMHAPDNKPHTPKITEPSGIAGGVRGFLRNIRKHLGLGAAA